MTKEARYGLPERDTVVKRMARASTTFDEYDAVHAEARRRMMDRLRLLGPVPRRVLDLGSATGKATAALAALYPQASVLAVELSRPMAAKARQRCSGIDRVTTLVGDAERLPLAAGSIDLVFASLLLPWCDPRNVFTEVARVLADGGLLLFTSVGPDTLREVRRAWSEVDGDVHVHGFFDMHDLGDLAASAGLAEPVMDVDRLQVTYADPERLVADLRACGATNAASGRRVQLTGRRRWEAFRERLEAQRTGGVLSISLELIFGQAWGTGRAHRAAAGVVGIPVAELTRTLRRGAGPGAGGGS